MATDSPGGIVNRAPEAVLGKRLLICEQIVFQAKGIVATKHKAEKQDFSNDPIEILDDGSVGSHSMTQSGSHAGGAVACPNP